MLGLEAWLLLGMLVQQPEEERWNLGCGRLVLGYYRMTCSIAAGKTTKETKNKIQQSKSTS